MGGLKAHSPLITAIIPNFNHGHLIRDCIQALKNQKFESFKVLIIDDASTDESLQIIEQEIIGDERFQLIKNENNLGAIKTLNLGIEMSRSTYIYLGAADDIVKPDLFQTLLKALESHNSIGFAVAEVELVDIDSDIKHPQIRPFIRPAKILTIFSPSEVPKLLKHSDNWALTGAALLRREKVLDFKMLSPELGSGADGFLLKKIALAHGFIFVPGVLLKWRRSNNGYSASSLSDSNYFARYLDTYLKTMEHDEIFPIWYRRKFRNRLEFSRKVFQFQSRENKLKPLNYFSIPIAYILLRPFSIKAWLKTVIWRKRIRP